MEYLHSESQIYANTIMKKRLVALWGKIRVYAWWIVYLLIAAAGLYLIGKPVISLIDTSIDIHALNKEKEKYEKIIEENNTFLENLKSREFLEQYARETYYMQNPNEQIYIIE